MTVKLKEVLVGSLLNFDMKLNGLNTVTCRTREKLRARNIPVSILQLLKCAVQILTQERFSFYDSYGRGVIWVNTFFSLQLTPRSLL